MEILLAEIMWPTCCVYEKCTTYNFFDGDSQTCKLLKACYMLETFSIGSKLEYDENGWSESLTRRAVEHRCVVGWAARLTVLANAQSCAALREFFSVEERVCRERGSRDIGGK